MMLAPLVLATALLAPQPAPRSTASPSRVPMVELFPIAIHVARAPGVAPTVSTSGIGVIVPTARHGISVEGLHFMNSLGHTTNVVALSYSPPIWRVGAISPSVEVGVTSRNAYPTLRRPVLGDLDFRVDLAPHTRLDVKAMPCGRDEGCVAAVGFGLMYGI